MAAGLKLQARHEGADTDRAALVLGSAGQDVRSHLTAGAGGVARVEPDHPPAVAPGASPGEVAHTPG